jgi:F-type H+-transporting ATPase subunit delta
VDNSGGIQASLSGRYATALFELAREGGSIETVESSLSTVRQALTDSADFASLTTSPLIGRGDAANGVAAAAKALKLDSLTANFLGVLAQNRRLRELPAIARAFRALAANHRGEVTAGVVSAHPLTNDQVEALKAQLRQRVGRDVNVDLSVDASLLGGLVVKIGSQMIDSSIKTRLNSLAHAMKG